MKSLKTSLKLYLAFLSLSVISYACCEETNLRIAGEGFISAYDFDTERNFTQDEQGQITGPFLITVNHEISAVAQRLKAGLLSQSFATTCPQNYLNELDSTSFSLSFNKAFSFQNDTILAGENFKHLEDLRVDIFWGDLSVDFPEEFMTNAQFYEEGPYTISLSIATNEGALLKNEMLLDFEL